MLPALYELSAQYKEALESLGDLDLPDEVVKDTLQGLTGDLEIKAKDVASFVLHIEAMSSAIKEAESKMSHRRKVLENRAKGIREYIKSCMETAGISKIECPYFKLQIKNNPGSVIIEDEKSIPAEYLRIPELPPPQPDKKLIGEALKNGKEVSGCRFEKGTRLSID
jgi:hypothetical protein